MTEFFYSNNEMDTHFIIQKNIHKDNILTKIMSRSFILNLIKNYTPTTLLKSINKIHFEFVG